jgi:hypothetical protein
MLKSSILIANLWFSASLGGLLRRPAVDSNAVSRSNRA